MSEPSGNTKTRGSSGVLDNAASYYLVRAVEYLAPLIVLPYLARVLGAAGWGEVLLAQGIAAWLALLWEYGFGLSATRDVARSRQDVAAVRRIVTDVSAAKLGLIAAVTIPAAAVLWLADIDAGTARLAWCAWALAVAQGLSPLWLYQGLERVRFAAVASVAGRMLGVCLVFLAVRGPDDGWKAVAAIGCGALASTVAMSWRMASLIGFARPRAAGAVAALRGGWSLFVFRGAVSCYTIANTILLGLLAGPASVAYFGSAEKLAKGVGGLLTPLSNAVYPQVNSLVAADFGAAVRFLRTTATAFLALSVGLAAALYLSGPFFIGLLFGAEFRESVPLLRILSATLPLIAAGNVLGIQWLVPLGLERVFSRAVIMGGIVNVGLALVLVPRSGATGMATSVLCAETTVTVTMLAYLHRRDLGFWTTAARTAAGRIDLLPTPTGASGRLA
jgi:PST family polysaccharide transporter